MEAESKSASGERHSDLRLCFRLFLRPPPRLHHRRQFLASRVTHRLATSMFLRGSLSLLLCRPALLLGPPGPLRSSYFGSCRCTHSSTLPSACLQTFVHLARTTTPCLLGT